MNPAADGFDLETMFVHLADGAAATPIEVGPDFRAELARRPELHTGRMMAGIRLERSPPHWEMHPAGDEVICLLSGSIDVVLEEPGGARVIPLRQRATCIIPSGVWHRALVLEESEVIAITRGAGTERRPA